MGDLVPDEKTVMALLAMYVAPFVIIGILMGIAYLWGSHNGYDRGFCDAKSGTLIKGQCVHITPVEGRK